MSFKSRFNATTAYLKKNLVLVLSLLFNVIIVIALLCVFYWQKSQSVSTSSSLKTEESISQSPVVSQPVIQNPTAPAVKAGTETTKVLFCLRLDGRQDGHLPALMGSEAKDAYPNGLDGSNWNLEANSTGKEDYGVMPDKTVFAKEAFLKKWGMASYVEIKTDQTAWAPVKLEKGVVGGEPAYTFKLK